MVNQPHGGRLVCRELTGKERDAATVNAKKLPFITVNSWVLSDIELIGTGDSVR